MDTQDVTSKSPNTLINTELASRRTGMSFQRTRMSAGRTLMSVIRTSLSLIGFGMLTIGIWYHVRFMLGLRNRRREMTTAGLIHAQSEYPVSLTLIGVMAVVGMEFNVGRLA